MLWKILIISASLEVFGMMISSALLSGFIHFFIFLALAGLLIQVSKWLLAANKEVEQLLKLSI